MSDHTDPFNQPIEFDGPIEHPEHLGEDQEPVKETTPEPDLSDMAPEPVKRKPLRAPRVFFDRDDLTPPTNPLADGPWGMLPEPPEVTEADVQADLDKLAQERDLALIAGYRQSVDFLCSLVDDHKVSPVLVNEAIRDLQGVFCTALRPLNP